MISVVVMIWIHVFDIGLDNTAPPSVFKSIIVGCTIWLLSKTKATVIIPAGLRNFGLGALIKADNTLVVWISQQLLFLSELGRMLVLKTTLLKGKHNDTQKDFTATPWECLSNRSCFPSVSMFTLYSFCSVCTFDLFCCYLGILTCFGSINQTFYIGTTTQ